MKKNLIKIVSVALVAGFILMMTGCNTTRGAGEDMQKAGEGIQHSAEKHGAD